MPLSILHLRQPALDGPPGARDRARPATARPRRRPLHARHYALAALLALTALAYVWDLGASNDANSFYAAAVQAGTRSWKAFFFGSLDASSFITVDKPPASLWVMELSGRIFGFSSWSMLVPQALEGVAAVALLYGAVRRWFGDWAGIAAGALLALTPVAALMFRFNNPDALLVLLLVAGAYCLVRAIERGATRWILAAGAMVGFAFLAKMLQAFTVLPGFALVYLLAAPGPLRRRTWQVLASGAAVIVSCGWWLLAVAVWPVADRPMIDGSPTNNIFNLIFGYNGLGRIFGAGGGGGGGASFSGSPGLTRLFNDLMGGQISWLLPAALIALVAGIAARGRAPRTDRTRAALLVWGGWLLVTGLLFSFSSGIIHTYYTVELAPAVAGLVAIGGWQAWQARTDRRAQALVALAIAVTAAWSCVLLHRAPSWNPWLTPVVIGGAVLGLAGLAVAAWSTAASATASHPNSPAAAASAPASRRGSPLLRRIGIAGAVLASVACLAGPVAYTVDAVTTAHTGSTPTAGPTTGGVGRGGFAGGFGRGAGGGLRSGGGSGFGGSSGGRGGLVSARGAGSRSVAGAPGGSGAHGASVARAGGGGAGGMGGSSTVSAALRRALRSDAGRYRWVAATSGSQSAAGEELATGGDPVMAIGGFSGEGGHISLASFEHDVAKGEIHYFIASGGTGGGGVGGGAGGGVRGGRGAAGAGGFGGGSGSDGSTTSAITAWVQSHYTRSTIGGVTVYNLTSPR